MQKYNYFLILQGFLFISQTTLLGRYRQDPRRLRLLWQVRRLKRTEKGIKQ